MLRFMRDEQYAAQDLPSYGAHEQPALVSRTHGQLRKTLLGTVVAALAVGSAVAGLVGYPDIDGVFQGRGWAQAMVAAAVAMLGLCLWQHLSWQRASAVWHGRRDSDLAAVVAVSWILQLVSYAVAVLALVICIITLVEVGRFATTAVFVVASLVLVLAAQVLAGVQYVRAEGPPGATPAHLAVRD